MRKKLAQLLVVVSLVIIFGLSILPVSAKQRNQGGPPTPTPPPVSGLQELRPFVPETVLQTAAESQVNDLPEAVDLRTATAKHYRLGANLYRAEISAAPLHYQDADGDWQEIDLRPTVRSQGGFEVVANNVKMIFPERLATGLAIDATVYPIQSEKFELPPRGPAKPDSLEQLATLEVTGQANQTPPARQLSLLWQPKYLVYANAAGPVSAELPVAGDEARSDGEAVAYAEVFDQVTVSFQASPFGFSQQLRLDALPGGLGPAENATHLEYVVYLPLPPDIQLYSEGLLQLDDFATHQLELRDQAGQTLFILLAPQLRDQTVSRASPQAPYRVERAAEGINLIAELPLPWLQDAGRQYPVVVEFLAVAAMGLTTELFPLFQDTWIYECIPDGGVNTARMWVGHFATGGCIPGVERSLVEWTTDSLPQDALIIDDTTIGPTQSFLYRLPTSDAGSGTLMIGTHRLLFAPWDFDTTSWLVRQGTDLWTQPGAEEDYLVAAEDIVPVPAGGSEGYISMGAVDSLVGSWHTWQYYAPWGNENDGVIYKSTSESGPNRDRAFAQLGFSGVVSAPILSVTYFTDTTINLTPNTNYFLSRAPSPDYFELDPVSTWRAVGIRAVDGGSDYDLFLSPSPNFDFTNVVTESLQIGSAPDFIVIRPDVSATLYPWAAQWEGTGLYYQRYATGNQTLPPNSTINGQAFTYTVLSIYQLNLNAGFSYQIDLDVTSGNQDLGLGLFPSAAAGGSQYMARESALRVSDSASFGGNEKMAFQAETGGSYGLVVWNNGGTQNSNYALTLEAIPAQQAPLKIYLPVVLKNFTPPLPNFANGSFESNTFSPWVKRDVSGPLVATIVSNSSPVPAGCFSGNYTARLGTPGQLPENTIPIGEVYIEQGFSIPAGKTQLSFKYWVSSYDIIKGSVTGRSYDKFEVTVDGNSVLIAGNEQGSSDGETLWESGCKSFSIPVTPGENVRLRFSVFNETNFRFNTWAYVDNVSLQ